MAYIMKQITRVLPDGHVRTHYMRLAGLGDGPITSPDQNPETGEIEMPDDYVGSGPAPNTFDESQNQVVATVGPIITGVTGAVTSTVDWLKAALASAPPSSSSSVATSVAAPKPNLLVLAAVALGGYAAYKHLAKPAKASTRRSYVTNPGRRRRARAGWKAPSGAFRKLKRGMRVRTPYGTGKITGFTNAGVVVRDEVDGDLIRANYNQVGRP